MLYTLAFKESGLVIGDCGLVMMEAEGKAIAELGYELRSDCWGKGVATRAASVVRNHVFAVLRMPRSVSVIRQGSDRLRRMAERIGMTLERELDLGGATSWRLRLYGTTPT